MDKCLVVFWSHDAEKKCKVVEIGWDNFYPKAMEQAKSEDWPFFSLFNSSKLIGSYKKGAVYYHREEIRIFNLPSYVTAAWSKYYKNSNKGIVHKNNSVNREYNKSKTPWMHGKPKGHTFEVTKSQIVRKQ